jgi:hypothetical protein
MHSPSAASLCKYQIIYLLFIEEKLHYYNSDIGKMFQILSPKVKAT